MKIRKIDVADLPADLNKNNHQISEHIDSFLFCPKTSYPIYVQDDQYFCPHKFDFGCYAGWRDDINRIIKPISCNKELISKIKISTPEDEIKELIKKFQDKNDPTFSIEYNFLGIYFRTSFEQALRNLRLKQINYQKIIDGSISGFMLGIYYAPSLLYDSIEHKKNN